MEKIIPELATIEAASLFFTKENSESIISLLKNRTGIYCPHCDHFLTCKTEIKARYQCRNKACRKQFSLRKGTLFEGSLIPIEKWMLALWILSSGLRKKWTSQELAKVLEVQQKTAWFMQARIKALQAASIFRAAATTPKEWIDEKFAQFYPKAEKRLRSPKKKGDGGLVQET